MTSQSIFGLKAQKRTVTLQQISVIHIVDHIIATVPQIVTFTSYVS